MKLLKSFLFLLLILIIGSLIYVAVQPNDYLVTRTKTINAPAELVYNNVIDFKNWEHWSAWVEKDSNLIITYPENTKGVGGHYSWEDKDGIGTMKTLATVKNASIDQELQFDDFEPSKIAWVFKPHANGTTEVTWSMIGENVPFGFKAFAAIQGGFDAMIGPDFERGLEKLDSLMTIEKLKNEAKSFKLSSVTQADLPTQKFIGYHQKTSTNIAMESMSKLFMEFMPKAGQYVAGKLKPEDYTPGTYYTKWDEVTGEAEFYIGLLLKKNIAAAADMTTITLPKGKVVTISKYGNYGTGEVQAHTAIAKFLEANNLKQIKTTSWELYVNDPMEVKPQDIQTDIYYPVN